jgi:hypothetical protein
MSDDDAVAEYKDANGNTYQMTKTDAERAGFAKVEAKRGPGRPPKSAEPQNDSVTPTNKAVKPADK